MSRTHIHVGKIAGAIAGLAIAFGGSPEVQGAAPGPAPVLGDSPKSQALLAQAEKDAGTQWKTAFEFLCRGIGAGANRPDHPVIEPVRLFDNVYAIGRTSTVTYAVTTSDGIVLIDAGYRDDVETVLLPGLRKLGLDPAQIKSVIVLHGHADHYGGAKYLQDTYATKIYLTSADWTVATTPAPVRPGVAPPANPVVPPRPDMTIVSGRPIMQGTTQFMPVAVPGHTPGAIGLIFPVTDGGRQHVAGIQGGAFLVQGFVTDEGLREYSTAVPQFAEMAAKMGVDVELQNHPMYDNMENKLTLLAARKPGSAHPFVVGKDEYQRFLRVMSGCADVESERRAAGRAASN